MEEIQPLDLSMRAPVVPELPFSGQQAPGSKPSQDLPLCLIKDCRCDKHRPNPRQPGNAPVFSDVNYDQPAVDEDGPRRLVVAAECRPVDSETGGYDPRGYGCSPVPRRDIWKEGSRPWETRRLYCEERMNINTRQCDEIGPPAQNRFNSSLCPYTRTDAGTPNFSYSAMSKYYDTDDHNTQSYLDLMNSGNNMDTAWKSTGNNEESSNDESNTAQSWKLKRDWDRATSGPPKIHWRPFGDSTTHSESSSTSHQSSQEIITSTSSQMSDQTTVCTTSEASKVSQAGAGGKVIILSSTTSQPPIIRSVGHCFASTVPLISHSTPVPAAPEVHNLPLSGGMGASAASLMATRPQYSSIRVTRSPKTFHNELARTFHELSGRGQAVKRSQDGGKRQVLDKAEVLEKENINRSTEPDTSPGEDVPIGVRMPALDYLISKVLVERIDIPFKPCNAEIKKIYNGESKGRLRLVDLIELQVEESLKA